jgi:hypothetical protein
LGGVRIFWGFGMAEKQHITRVSDSGTGGEEPQDQNGLNLNGICTKSDRSCGTRRTSGDPNDNYIYFGGTDQDRAGADTGGQRYEGGSQVTLKSGETFWKLAEQKYGGKHPIEAIYAANGLYPKVTEKDGKIEMTDPTYQAGKSYTMPSEKDIAALTKQYRQHVEEQGRSSQERVGAGEEASKVKLIYGDTFERMARAKYGHEVPAEAIYQANGLKQTFTEKNGETCAKDPIYYAGKTYTLPAEKDIPDLVRQYWDGVGHPEKCPPQYRSRDGENGGRDNYGQDGETDRDRAPVAPPVDTGRDQYGRDGETDRDRQDDRPYCPEGDRQREDGGRRDQGDRNGDQTYNEGYEDGYRDAMNRGQRGQRGQESQCDCRGAGCDACGGSRSTRPPRESQCGCGGAGCANCMGNANNRDPYIDQILYYRQAGRDYTAETQQRNYELDQQRRRQQGGCTACGGGGCDSCYDTDNGPRRPHRRTRQ